MGTGSYSNIGSSQGNWQSQGTDSNAGPGSQRLMPECRHLREKGIRYLPTAVTGLAEGHILFFLAVHAKTDLGRFLTGVQLELHLGHIVKEFGKVLLNL